MNAAPARGPSTRLTSPSSPMAMPTTCAESDRSSISLSTARLSASVWPSKPPSQNPAERPQFASAACSRPFGARKVVEADQQRRARGSQLVAEPGQLRRLGFFGRLHFEIDDLAAGLGGLSRAARTLKPRTREVARQTACAGRWRWRSRRGARRETPSRLGSAAAGLASESSRNSRNRAVRQCRLGALDHLRRRSGLNGHAQLAHAQAWEHRRGRGTGRVGTSGRDCHQLTHLNGVPVRMQQRNIDIAPWQAEAHEPGPQCGSNLELWRSLPIMPAENPAVLAASEDFHAWEAGGAASAEALAAWVGARLAAHEAALAALLAVEGTAHAGELAAPLRRGHRTAQPGRRAGRRAQLRRRRQGRPRPGADGGAAGGHGRQRAQPEPRRSTRRLAAIDLEGASPATKHFVERTLLSYRLAGVDKDQATRDHLQALHEKATRLSLEFSRNIQEGGKTIEATRGGTRRPARRLPRAPSGRDADGRT